MNFKTIIAAALTITTLAATAQTPAKPQKETIVLKGGTAHTGDGQVINNATIVFQNGKITYIGTDNNIPAGAKVIDVTGKQVYPGLIAPNTILGLSEIDAVRSTQDNAEVGTFNANIRSVIAFNTDSRVTPTVRSNGILMAEVAPRAGVISGSSSVMELDGWNWEDAAYKMDIGLHLNWPGIYSYNKESGVIEINKDYDKSVDQIKAYLAQAKAYAQTTIDRPENLKFDAMKGLFDKSKKLFVHVGNPREIMTIVDLNKSYGFDLVLVTDQSALTVADLLKENHIAVVLANIHSMPNQPEDDVYLSYKTPYLLKQAGVDFCLSLDGAWQQRNLPFLAGTASAYGLTKEEALAAITSNTARILGIDKNVGTLTAGKDATIIVSTGDVLDMRTSNIEFAFIRGKQISLDNMQKALYQKYQAKYQDQK